MAKLIEITGKALSGEWGLEDESRTGIPVLRTTNFTNLGIINYGDVVMRNITKKNISEKFLRKGDIIIEKSGGSDKQPVGRVVLFNGEENRFLFNNFTGVLRVKDREKWVPDYVFHALFANYRNGGTRKYENKTTGLHNLKTDLYINNYEIEWVNIAEQKNVCATLRKIESIISDMNKEIAYLDELIKARFVEMFGDFDLAPQCNEWIKLSKLGEIVSGSTPKTGTAEYWDGDICWITPAELNSMSGIVYDSKKKITEAGRNSCSLRLMPINTVILSSRAPIGKVAILGKEMCCNQGFKNIICNEKILPKYLYYLLAYNTDYLNSLGRGATFKEISKKIVEDIRISLPSIEQQAKFITFSEQVDKSKFALSNELTMGNFYIRLIHDCIMHGSIDL